jgi:bacterioferritin
MSQPTIPNVVDQLRLRARQNIEAGAVTAGYSGDRANVVARLDVALAAEIVCVLRYRRHHLMAHDIHSQVVAQKFLADSNEEPGHADDLADLLQAMQPQPEPRQQPLPLITD